VKYGKNSVWKKIIASPFSILVLLVPVFVLGRAVLSMHQKANNSGDKLAQAELELAKLTERQRDISNKVENISTEQGIETEIRTKYHAVKQGESVSVIVDDSQTANASNVSSTSYSTSQDISWWRRILRIFGL